MRPRKVSRHCFPASDADPVRDFSPGDAGADVGFGPAGVKWRLAAIEDHQQFSLVGVDASQQTIQGGEADFGGEEGVEAPAQFPSPLRVRIFPIGLYQRVIIMTHRDGLSELSVRSRYCRDVGHRKMLATRPESSERPPFRSLLGPVGGRRQALTMAPHRLQLASYPTGPRSDPYGSLLSPFGIRSA